MASLKTTDPLALRLLLAEDLYQIKGEEKLAEPLVIEEGDESEPNFHYLGENNKYLLLLVNQPGEQVINSGDLEALKNILSAKSLELRDVAILNFAKYPGSNYLNFKAFFACAKIVLFGINPIDIELSNIVNNEIINIDGTKVLATYSFAEMQTDNAKKRLFWNQMKTL
jgi:DNA polymerase III psi subunit